MSLFSWLSGSASSELPDIFPWNVVQDNFVRTDVRTIYSRILTDVLERTQGIPPEKQKLLWDNCLGSEVSDGLVTLIATAMTNKTELFLIYDRAVDVIRKATGPEQARIREDYQKVSKSELGLYITFAKFDQTDMVKIYSGLEYCATGSLYKSMNLAKAVQIKIKELRSSVSLKDSSEATSQAVKIAQGLKDGKDVMTDSEDVIETAKPDLSATEAAAGFITKKQGFYLGLPASYLTGDQKKGLSDSGMADTRATERGLKRYYFSIMKPVIEELFDVKTEFKSQDFDMMDVALQALQTFEATSEEFMTAENKIRVVNALFGFPADEKGGPKQKPAPAPTALPEPGKPPAKVPAPAAG